MDRSYKNAGITLIAVACVLLLIAAGDLIQGTSSAGWQHTTGLVVKTDLKKDYISKHADCFFPVVEYTYKAGSSECKSNRISFPQPGSRWENNANDFLKAYPVGKNIDVFYDGHHPSDACLKRGVDDNTVYMTAIVAVIGFVIGVIFLFLAKLQPIWSPPRLRH